ncbi:MAG: hypothetical protein AAFP08_03715 [Bacteroidota bacterium]
MQLKVMDFRGSGTSPQSGKQVSGPSATWADFHAVLDPIYAGDPLYIYPLQNDLEDIFSEKNAAFTRGQARIWVAYSEAGKPIGRIAAFIDPENIKIAELAVGGIGYFESIKDDSVADALFTAAEDWLREQGMVVAEGPINFGERDKFWGLLVRGWYRPIYQETYNPPYYRPWLEDRGYTPYEQSLTLRGRLDEVPAERLKRLGTSIKKRYNLITKRITKDKLREGADDFAAAYNAAFYEKPHFKPLTGEQIYPSFVAMKPIMDTYLTCIAFEQDGTPVGLGGFVPDINGFMKGFKGKLNWRTLPIFLWRLKFQKARNFKGIALGVAPKYQRRGLYALLSHELYSEGDSHILRVYENMELSTIRGHNDIMIASCKAIGTNPHRIHLAYRKALTPDAKWEAYNMIPEDEVDIGDLSFWEK